MQRHSPRWLGLLAAILLLAGGAQATPVQLLIDGVVTEDATGLVGVGAGLSVNVYLDDATPNEDTSPNYLATGNPGTFDSFLILAVTGTVFDVTGTGSTNWDFTGEIDLTAVAAGLFLPVSVVTTGTGMTPGQIVPDYTSFTGGQISVDVGALFPGGFVKADVNSITIVPEPSTALLLGLGLTGLAIRRRCS